MFPYESFQALIGGDKWRNAHLAQSPSFSLSCVAIALYIPLYGICVMAAIKNGADYSTLPIPVAASLAAAMGPVFMGIAWGLAKLFNKTDTLNHWIAARNWTQLWIVTAMAGICGLFIVGVIPWPLTYSLAALLFLGTLAMDIRLAQTIMKFEMGLAILTGCAISIGGLMTLMLGAQFFSG